MLVIVRALMLTQPIQLVGIEASFGRLLGWVGVRVTHGFRIRACRLLDRCGRALRPGHAAAARLDLSIVHGRPGPAAIYALASTVIVHSGSPVSRHGWVSRANDSASSKSRTTSAHTASRTALVACPLCVRQHAHQASF